MKIPITEADIHKKLQLLYAGNLAKDLTPINTLKEICVVMEQINKRIAK